ncbi:hypothetical protein PSMK_17870 [Phycisphaera mikurensis NBRC 102666]|uniref:Sialate O-acetylesterase domain-containing protein n=2 Tax=Phycisphaera TaxID=666508 RepID=I0IFA8_PHYMF|nr:hypothetical protein PSMK_17870 [Phycisphaera mikurensis NBRC 102666]
MDMPFITRLIVLLVVASTPPAFGLRLHPLVGDHAVFQRDQPITVRGTARAGMLARAAFLDAKNAVVSESAPVSADGTFVVKLPPMPAGGPYTLRVDEVDPGRGNVGTIFCEDVAVGDLWLASGQSNMQWRVMDAADGAVVAAQSVPLVRHLQVARTASEVPLAVAEARWLPTTPQGTRGFSAVAHRFALEVHEATGVPIGVLHASWGGTGAASWAPVAALSSEPATASLIASTANHPDPQHRAGALYNAMIHPLRETPVTGVIWYQGESDASDAPRYRVLFPLLIKAWRAAWQRPDLPFLFVQLARYRAPLGVDFVEQPWPPLRAVQAETAATVPGAAMAVIVDLDDPDFTDIHPKDKAPVGRRLAKLALRDVYGRGNVAEGPRVEEVLRDGEAVHVRFATASPPLLTDDGKPPAEFWLRSANGRTERATSVLHDDTVRLTAEGVGQPVEVLYGWADNPIGVNLTDRSGLPAAPFHLRIPGANDGK